MVLSGRVALSKFAGTGRSRDTGQGQRHGYEEDAIMSGMLDWTLHAASRLFTRHEDDFPHTVKTRSISGGAHARSNEAPGGRPSFTGSLRPTRSVSFRVLPVAAALLTSLMVVSLARAQQPGGSAAAKSVESSPQALTAYADAANYQNRMAYELAAEEWARFLERFPSDPLAAKARHYRGICLVQLKQYAEAAKALQGVLENHPKFELREQTYLNLGWCQYQLATGGDKALYARAAETFGKLESSDPEGKYADQALFFKGESLYALGELKQAALSYGKLVTTHEESKLRPDALYALGVTLEEMKVWGQAAKSYRMFLEDYADNELATEVRMRLAEAILQGGDTKAAEAMFAQVAAVEGFSQADYALLRQAYCVASQGQDGQAAELYAGLVERFPKSAQAAEAMLSAARCYYRAGQWEESASWLDRVLASGADGAVEAAHWRCRLYLRDAQANEALSLAERMLPEAGDDPFVANLRLDRADALYQLPGRKADALKEYLAIVDRYDGHEVAPVALYDAAFAALELKDYQQATELAGRFLAAHPEHALTPDVRYVVAECKIQTQAYEEAEAIYRQIVESAGEHAELARWQVRYALVLYLQEKYQQALELLKPLSGTLQRPALKAEALYLVGASQFELGQHPEAAKSLRESLLTDARWSQADETLLYLARAQRKLNELPEAVASLENLLETYPESELRDQVHYQLGEDLYAANRLEEAIAAYDQVLQKFETSPYVPFALYGKGWAQLKSGAFDAAANTLTRLIDQHGKHALRDDALFARAMAYRQAKKYAESIADINRCLAGNPEFPQRADALYERGLAEALGEQYQEAVKTLKGLLESQPDYGNGDKVLYELGWAHKSLGDDQQAADAFARLVERHAGSPLAAEAHFHVGERAYADQDYAAAANAYRQAVRGASEGAGKNAALHEKALYKLGWTLYQQEKFEEAVSPFAQLLESYSGSQLASDAWFMKGECLFELEDFQKALPAYRKAMELEASSPRMAELRQLHAAQAAGQLKQWQESVALLDSLIADHPESHLLAEAYFERGQGKLKLEQLDAAADDFRQAADRSRGVVGVRALFMIGEIRFQQKRYEDAIKDFQRAMFRAVPENAPEALRDWQAKAGFEAGRCCEVRIGQVEPGSARAKYIADAKKFYQYVVQTHDGHDLAAEARKRLEALAKLAP